MYSVTVPYEQKCVSDLMSSDSCINMLEVDSWYFRLRNIGMHSGL